MSQLRYAFATFLVMVLFPIVQAQDIDSDAIDDNIDNCPSIPNYDQADDDGDGIGNVCDNCIMTANNDQLDDDMDGIGNACEDDESYPSELRLVGGSSIYSGRVEINITGSWGTICGSGNSFDYNDTKVICRQLGLPHRHARVL
ncbi:uncharacterized protein [Amphiura filiformis]|uniref:uncharacterized protein n=1 Tax=Amphiura filiformis TaxID=82378 RepID=UPI003B2251A8